MSKKTKITAIVILNFIIYISLGLPDSILGSAWPSMRVSYDMGASQVSYLSTIMLVFSFLSSVFYTKISQKLTVAQVIFSSMTFVIIGLILMMVTANPLVLFLATPFMGIGQGAIDVTVNHFAAKHLPSSLMSLLHGFYGLGVSLSAAILTFFLSTFSSWRLAIGFITVVEILILTLIFVYRATFAEHDQSENVAEKSENELKPKFRVAYFVSPLFYFFYSVEGVVGVFLATYYAEVFQVKPSLSAGYTTLFWLGLMTGRFLTGVLTRFLSDKKIIFTHLVSLIIMSFALLFPPTAWTPVVVFVLGLAMSALYPLLMMLPNQMYPEPIAQKVISYNVGFCLLGILVFPLLFGVLFRLMTFSIFPIFIISMSAILLILAICLYKIVEKQIKA
ncbi:MFS transporter [Lactococcus hodotermopsidis]|uniref:MFS transporter n=1 Tax=Pseudolactococcus hodotermopsidis TaxID=2709157 RepID=A0A6A0BFF9_9LACT|nr:MFS transporter [Lactococcus hodotermopsidis]GFH43214.1 MFS transporter [Lactococcus hodotermopsidis]